MCAGCPAMNMEVVVLLRALGKEEPERLLALRLWDIAGAQHIWTWVTDLPQTPFVTLSWTPNQHGPQFYHLKKRMILSLFTLLFLWLVCLGQR